MKKKLAVILMVSAMVLNPSYILSSKAERINGSLNIYIENKKPTQKNIEMDYVMEEKIKKHKMNEMQGQKEVVGCQEEHKNRTLLDKVYDDLFLIAGRKYDVDPALVKAVAFHESGYKKNIVSNKGASGLMQLMLDTAKGLGIEDVFNPEQNINGGAKYISQLLNKYGDIEIALAAYNAGPGNVDKYNGVPPFDETKEYINNVTSSYQLLKEKKVFKW